MESDDIEIHKFLPSGIWEGFYCYHNSPIQHKMSIEIRFAKNKVSGSGIDDIGTFKWSGKYNLNNFKINILKNYPSHNIIYNGDIDENGIWGIWNNNEDLSNLNFSPEVIIAIKKVFNNRIKGGFHIWPKRKNESAKESTEEKEQTKSLILEEIYIEQFR